ncbi:MAG TPA: ATP-dependent sacrificial sulfur transferase LarE [Pyrinomonadaceae bacterium]|nr:ATP-dependent sacrificial sulfur transferase LarE [Pyrinomonadaceae bacterium]
MIASRQKSSNSPPSRTAVEKEQKLRSLMRDMGRVLVAYSGGVDSSYLAYIAKSEIGERAVCVLGLSPSVSGEQQQVAEDFAKQFDLNIRTIETNELSDPNYTANPSNRCYFCKSELYSQLESVAAELGVDIVVDGANADDVSDYRPGRSAAAEHQVRSPLIEVGLTKNEIRELSSMHGLPTWDKPSSPCLSSRLAYGVPVTIERLSKVEQAESFLRGLGFREFRVRVHGELARIEIARGEMANAFSEDFADRVVERFRQIGFKYVTLDLQGFRSGAMNEILNK